MHTGSLTDLSHVLLFIRDQWHNIDALMQYNLPYIYVSNGYIMYINIILLRLKRLV